MFVRSVSFLNIILTIEVAHNILYISVDLWPYPVRLFFEHPILECQLHTTWGIAHTLGAKKLKMKEWCLFHTTWHLVHSVYLSTYIKLARRAVLLGGTDTTPRHWAVWWRRIGAVAIPIFQIRHGILFIATLAVFQAEPWHHRLKGGEFGTKQVADTTHGSSTHIVFALRQGKEGGESYCYQWNSRLSKWHPSQSLALRWLKKSLDELSKVAWTGQMFFGHCGALWNVLLLLVATA